MTTQQIMDLAKEKLGRDITDQEAQDYMDGKTAIPDEFLDVVSGGGKCKARSCPQCESDHIVFTDEKYVCQDCGFKWLYDPIAS